MAAAITQLYDPLRNKHQHDLYFESKWTKELFHYSTHISSSPLPLTHVSRALFENHLHSLFVYQTNVTQIAFIWYSTSTPCKLEKNDLNESQGPKWHTSTPKHTQVTHTFWLQGSTVNMLLLTPTILFTTCLNKLTFIIFFPHYLSSTTIRLQTQKLSRAIHITWAQKNASFYYHKIHFMTSLSCI